MRKLLILMAVLFAAASAHAQEWTREIAKEFKKTKQVAVKIDLSNATIMDVSLVDYPEYYSGKFSSNEKYANLVLEKFKNRFLANCLKRTKKIEVAESEAKFVIEFKFSNITEKGGFSGVYHIVTQDNYSEDIHFSQKDGRWNNFETLLMENVDKFWEKGRLFTSKKESLSTWKSYPLY